MDFPLSTSPVTNFTQQLPVSLRVDVWYDIGAEFGARIFDLTSVLPVVISLCLKGHEGHWCTAGVIPLTP